MVFENKYYLPHVYSATTPIAVDGGMDAYFASLQTENINNKDSAAIFLSQQLSQGQWQFIENYKNSSLNYAKTQSSSPVLTFNAVNPTKYEVHVENATGPFFLVFNENFDSQWKAYIRDLNNNPEGGSIPEEKHFLANGYANAWYIDPQQLSNGTWQFNVTLYYSPQNYYDAGLLITGITFALIICYLTYQLKPIKLRIRKKLLLSKSHY